MLVRLDFDAHKYSVVIKYISTLNLNGLSADPISFFENRVIFRSSTHVFTANIVINLIKFDKFDYACQPVWIVHFSSVLWSWYLEHAWSDLISIFTNTHQSTFKNYIAILLLKHLSADPISFFENRLIIRSSTHVLTANIVIYLFMLDKLDFACPPVWVIHFSSVLWSWNQ